MTKQEWENAFGPVPEDLKRTVARRLRMIEEEGSVRRIKGMTIVAVACAVTLITAIAYAAATQWDMQSFMGRWFGAEITEQGQQALQTMKAGEYSAENGDVTVTVRQALYDGNTLYVMLAATPKASESTLLLPLDSLGDDPVSNLGHPEYENDLTPIKDSELAKGKTLLGVESVVRVNGIEPSGNGHQAMEADGTLVTWLETPIAASPGRAEIQVECVTNTWRKDVAPEALQFESCAFTFPLKATKLSQDAVVWPTPEGT